MHNVKSLSLTCFLFAVAATATHPRADIKTVIKPQLDSPLHVVEVSCQGQLKAKCSATVRNSSRDAIGAYGLIWRFVYTDGKFFITHGTVDRTLIKPHPMLPNDTAEDFEGSETTITGLSRLEVEVDFVLPVKGKAWGNTKTSEGYLKLVGLRAGYNQALAHLRQVYLISGPAGVRKELGIQ